MNDILSSLVVVGMSTLVLAILSSTWKPMERKLVWLGWGFHTAASLGMLYISFEIYGVADTISYFHYGDTLARFMEIGGWPAQQEVLKLIFQADPWFPFLVMAPNTSTGTMSGTAAYLLTVSPSYWACSLFCGNLALSGQVATFFGLRHHLEEQLHKPLLLACLFLPSVAYWTGGLIKESFAVFGTGWLIFGLSLMLRGKTARGILLAAMSVGVIALVKPYVIFPLVGGCGAFWYFRGGRASAISIPRVVVGSSVTILAVIALGQLFPEYDVSKFGEMAAQRQMRGANAGGGSFSAVSDGMDTSLVGQLSYAPLGILSTLFRPVFIEVRNANMALSAIETTSLTVLTIRAFMNRGTSGVFRSVFSSPAMMFCATLTLLSAAAIGITTTNLGTLSRYRVPMMPFYAFVLLALNTPSFASQWWRAPRASRNAIRGPLRPR